MIVSHYMPEKVIDSLNSLAGKKSEKLYRKKLLIDITCERFGRNIQCDGDLNDVFVQNKPKFGDLFTVDVIFLYILKHKGMETVSKIVDGIPQEAVSLVESLSLDWYEKLNPAFLNEIPEKFRKSYLGKLAVAGITPYTDEDWREFQIIRNFLLRYNVDLLSCTLKNGIAVDPGDLQFAVDRMGKRVTESWQAINQQKQEISRLNAIVSRHESVIAQQEKKLKAERSKLRRLRSSKACRIGLFLTAPLRHIKRLIKMR